jgi:hypothetical protein
MVFPDELDGLLDRVHNDDICAAVKPVPDVTVEFLRLERTSDFFVYTQVDQISTGSVSR